MSGVRDIDVLQKTIETINLTSGTWAKSTEGLSDIVLDVNNAYYGKDGILPKLSQRVKDNASNNTELTKAQNDYSTATVEGQSLTSKAEGFKNAVESMVERIKTMAVQDAQMAGTLQTINSSVASLLQGGL
jgi:hypothetical protein